jgi:hypothetical protein
VRGTGKDLIVIIALGDVVSNIGGETQALPSKGDSPDAAWGVKSFGFIKGEDVQVFCTF